MQNPFESATPISPGELASNEPHSGGLKHDDAISRWGRFPRRAVDKLLFYEAVRAYDGQLVDKLLSEGADGDEILRQLSEPSRRVLLREGLYERWNAGEIECFGFPLHTNGDRRVRIQSALIDDLRYGFDGEEVRNFQGRRGSEDHPQARIYNKVRFYLTGAVSAPAAAELPPAQRRVDPRNMSSKMLAALEKAVEEGLLVPGRLVTLKEAHGAMLRALDHKGGEPPRGMGDDAFAKHCKAWLVEQGFS